MRAFIAIPSPTIDITIPKIKGIRPIPPQNRHITLKFFRNITSQEKEEIGRRLTFIEEMEQFAMTLKGVGGFPTPTSPRVIWIGIEKGAYKIIEIKRQLDRMLKDFKSMDPKVFHPHVTIARVKKLEDKEKLASFFERYREREFGTCGIEKLVFMQSVLRRSGAVYEVLSEFAMPKRESNSKK